MPNDPASETLEIERIVPGGDGLGRRANGERVFVAHTAPGDRVEIAALEYRKGVAHGHVKRLVLAGPERVTPRCPAVEHCGGCDFMHLSTNGQRAAKVGILEDALRRVGNIAFDCANVNYVTVGDGFGYRGRIRLHVSENGEVGFLSARSKRVVCIDNCAVVEPALNFVLQALGTASESTKRLLKLCSELELRTAATEPTLVVRLFPRPKVKLHVPSFSPLFPAGAKVVIAGSEADHEVTQSYALPGGLAASVPASAFTQVNRGVNTRLVEDVVRAAVLRQLHSFVDPYAGAGNFTLPLLMAGLTGESIDTEPAGILAARRVARERGLPFTGFNIGDAKAQLEALVRDAREFDFALLDPPRVGAKSILPLVKRLRPQLIALVGCDPVSLARDLKELTASGASLESLTVYDMFPQTHHVETLALVGDVPTN